MRFTSDSSLFLDSSLASELVSEVDGLMTILLLMLALDPWVDSALGAAVEMLLSVLSDVALDAPSVSVLD